MPHVRQFIRVRQALVRAQAGDTTVTALLETPRIGVLHLDRRGRILAVNDRARRLLRRRAGVSDAAGVLQARAPDDQGRLARLVAEALPTSSAVPVSGSMLLGRAAGVPPLVVHVTPVGVPPPDYGARPVAALAFANWLTWSAWVKWCSAWGEASRIAFTGPGRSAMTSPTGTKPSRLRSMPYSPMFPG